MSKGSILCLRAFSVWAFSFILLSCQAPSAPGSGSGSSGQEPYDPDWLVPEHEVVDGGPGKDGIPSIDDPQFAEVSTVSQSFLQAQDLVVGVRIGDDIRAYPHPIMDWHEIVNDEVGGLALALTFCPLTGTALCWNRKLARGLTTFGVSGLLYKSNLIPYDRDTDSEWSQMLIHSIHGTYKGEPLTLFPLVETSWETWKKLYPQSQVLTTETGYDRPYGEYPYGDYKTQEFRLIFPMVPLNKNLPLKERVLGVRVNEKLKAYRFSAFDTGIGVINDEFEGEPLVIAGSKPNNLLIAFSRRLNDTTILQLTPLIDQLPLIMQDQMGNKWDVFGHAAQGPLKGSKLTYIPSMIGYWVALAAFYWDPVIYE